MSPRQPRSPCLSLLVAVLAAGCGNGPSAPDAGDAALSDADLAVDAETARPLGMVGDPCDTDEDCLVASDHGRVACLRAAWGFRQGYCTVVGVSSENQCLAADELSTLVDFPCAQPVCMLRCEEEGSCREGYECFLGLGACWPRCSPGRACPVPPPQLCEIDEDCDDHDDCTTDGCIDGVCDHDRIDWQPRRAARIATRGEAIDIDFTGRIENDSLRVNVAEGVDGLEIFDLSNPTEPRVYARVDTAGPAVDVLRHGDIILVAEQEEGIEIFDPNGGSAIDHILIDDGAGAAFGVSPRGNNIGVHAYRDGLIRFSVESRALVSPPCDTRGRAVDGVFDRGTHTSLIADSLAGLAVCSWEEGTDFATQIGRLDTDGRMLSVSRSREVLAAAEAGAGFGIFDVSDPRRPIRMHASEMLDGDVLDVHLAGETTLVVAASEGGVYFFSLEDCFEPVLISRWETDGPALALDYTDGVVAVALGEAGVELVDIGCRATSDEE